MDGIAVVREAPTWRLVLRRLLVVPGIRWLGPGWPDAGRRIVQLPALEPLIERAVSANPPMSTVLNAGVGEGLYSPTIRRYTQGATLLEFDFAPPRRSDEPHTQRFRASLTAIPVRSASVDLAVCTEVLEHVADDRQAVAELRRVLKPRGFLVLSVPTPPAIFDPAHAREGYTLDELRDKFEVEGLTIIEVRFCMHAFFQAVLRYWRPRRMPLGLILALAWLDRVIRPGKPMDMAVLAQVVR